MLKRSHQLSLKQERVSNNSATFFVREKPGWIEGYWAHAYSWAGMKLSGIIAFVYLSMALS